MRRSERAVAVLLRNVGLTKRTGASHWPRELGRSESEMKETSGEKFDQIRVVRTSSRATTAAVVVVVASVWRRPRLLHANRQYRAARLGRGRRSNEHSDIGQWPRTGESEDHPGASLELEMLARPFVARLEPTPAARQTENGRSAWRSLS